MRQVKQASCAKLAVLRADQRLRKGHAMGSPRFFWAVTVAVIPLSAPACSLAQTSGGMRFVRAGPQRPILERYQHARPPEAPRAGPLADRPDSRRSPARHERLEPPLYKGQGVFPAREI